MKIETPIFDFVSTYSKSGTARFHMPGHKGKGPIGCESLDITEIRGADVLYSPDGIISRSEDIASSLFGTAHTYYSTEGSTLAIRVMLSIAIADSDKAQRPLILAARNVHSSFVSACALLDIDVSWVYPDKADHICRCIISAEKIREELDLLDRRPSAVYLTSPDYLGTVLDIEAIAKVCREYGVPLLVDNAHGAYLGFLEKSQHPIHLGATMCADSAHKTLPVLTGGAYLHISHDADPLYLDIARDMFRLFASTSPSYLVLQSLDLCNELLAGNYKKDLKNCLEKVSSLKARISSFGYCLEDSEPLKIVINTRKSGFLGEELFSLLEGNGIEAEFGDDDVTVFMITPSNTEEEFLKLERALLAISKHKKTISEPSAYIPIRPERIMSIREAALSRFETIDVQNAEGRICSNVQISCPPAVPIAVCGEIITEEIIKNFLRYGIKRVNVVK